jgi:nucleoside-diphosphate-sugar epimerase
VLESLDTERLRSLGWRPSVGLEDGIARSLAALRG